MKISERLGAAWRGLTGRRDPYAGTYGNGSGGGFAGAAVNRLTASLSSWSGSINADLDIALPILRARARSLAANNEHGRRFLEMVAENVVGRRNPKLQVRAMRDQANPNKPTTLDKPANDAIEIHWERWGRTADISGRHKSLYALLRTAVKGAARDGEALIRKVRDRKLPYGYALQLLEADRLDETINMQLQGGHVVRQGIEIDSTQRAVAYYVKTAHPGDRAFISGSLNIERVPASDMFHLFLPARAEQVRGITWMHAVILRGSIIHRFEEAAVIAAEVGASKIAALERSDEALDATASLGDAQVGHATQMNVQAGEMFELPPGYKLNSWNPEYPHANFESFLKACLRGLAAGLNVAAHNLTGDMTDVNYSSARIAELAERESWMGLQDWLIDSLMIPLYEDWLEISLLKGAITFDVTGKALPAERLDKFRLAARFQGRRWAWVDPMKEAEAQEKLLNNLLTSRTRIAAEQGEEFDDILDELAAEKGAIDAAGMAPPPPPPAKPPAAPPADPNLAKALTLLAARAAAPDPAPGDTHIHNNLTVPERSVTVEAAQVTVATGETRIENHIPEREVNLEANITVPHPERKVTEIERDEFHEAVRTVETFEMRTT